MIPKNISKKPKSYLLDIFSLYMNIPKNVLYKYKIITLNELLVKKDIAVVRVDPSNE